MTEQLFVPKVTCKTTQMLQNNNEIGKRENKTLLSSLTLEVDDIFFSLRKADRVIRRELNLLRNQNYQSLKTSPINPIDEERFKTIINKIYNYQILLDEYILYMLEDKDNSIFKLIREYNQYIEQRKNEIVNYNYSRLISIDEKLAHYTRQLGAMTYHLNIHLNLLTVLLRNASVAEETQQTAIREIKEIVTEYIVNEWGEQQQGVKFREISIDGYYAVVTWAIENFRGDAILLRNEGYWQLLNISAGMFGLKDFENAGVPLEVAQRVLRLHHQKLGY
jgi:hypothetical protein